MTSAWKLPQLGVVNSGGRRSRTFTPKDPRQQPNTDISFNKTPRVAEDAWVRLSDGFSSTFDRKGENERRRKVCPSQSTHTHVFKVEPRAAWNAGGRSRFCRREASQECLSATEQDFVRMVFIRTTHSGPRHASRVAPGSRQPAGSERERVGGRIAQLCPSTSCTAHKRTG